MSGVCCLCPTFALAYLQIVLLYDIIETIVADAMRWAEPFVVHGPQFSTTNTWIFTADFLDKLHNEGLVGQVLHQSILILVKGLLTYTK